MSDTNTLLERKNVIMGERDGNEKSRETNWVQKQNERKAEIGSDLLLVWLNEKKDKRDGERWTTGAENPLGDSGVAKMMCGPVISRHVQSLQPRHLAWLSMIDIYLQIPVIHQCHISAVRLPIHARSKECHGLPYKESDWT